MSLFLRCPAQFWNLHWVLTCFNRFYLTDRWIGHISWGRVTSKRDDISKVGYTCNAVYKKHVKIRIIERGKSNQPVWQRLGWPRSHSSEHRARYWASIYWQYTGPGITYLLVVHPSRLSQVPGSQDFGNSRKSHENTLEYNGNPSKRADENKGNSAAASRTRLYYHTFFSHFFCTFSLTNLTPLIQTLPLRYGPKSTYLLAGVKQNHVKMCLSDQTQGRIQVPGYYRATRT